MEIQAYMSERCVSRVSRTVIALAIGCAASSVATGLAAQVDRPLPDRESFLEEVRANLRFDNDILDGYTFLERRIEADVSFFGGVSADEPKLYRVYRSRELSASYRRLLEVDGKPLTVAELLQQDRRHLAERLRIRRDRARENDADREKRERLAAEEAEEDREMMEEMLGLYDYRLEGREVVDGRSTIVVSFTPLDGLDPKTRPGRILAKLAGRAWVSEDEHQVIRVEAETVRDVTIGWGLVARLHKGSRIDVRRIRVGDRWLPAGFDFVGSGRTVLFRTFAVELHRALSDFELLTADMLPYAPLDANEAEPRSP